MDCKANIFNKEMDNIFSYYQSREALACYKWLKSIGIKDENMTIINANTFNHDLIVKIKGNKNETFKFFIEVNEESKEFFRNTGNLCMDAISAFFIEKDSKKRYPNPNTGFWVNKGEVTSFLGCINVKKYGKLFTCDADVQLFFVEDEDFGDFYVAYNQHKILNERTQGYFLNQKRLRVNNKNAYRIKDKFLSAFFNFKPRDFNEFKRDEIMSEIEIKNKKDLFEVIKANQKNF